ncbi:amidohydrolase family protein [Paenibacillus sacheonensis]|uniref:Amidohydrolase family protein n=1 Tax=Paenibacillus sacheonensis TaxID=742054 RepID=A0A7X4YM04_9BACL|nr:amidohydrolase family protein [Paenibacillus sacheonensis]MBM7565864.1 putative TIM-barrel fold metal-dependent hydrolase [Paenibacillus sacheonensis]NBC68818.1 amidohydrolase family protein [Paenibacillus sacheonensis]
MQKADMVLFDTDIHNEIADQRQLLPFLPEIWHKQWMQAGTGIGMPFFSPVGVLRRDAITESGGTPGSDPSIIVKEHLDLYGFRYGLLNWGRAIEMSIHPDPDYANAIVSAHNDFMETECLTTDSRFRGSIVINHSDPAAAATEIDRMAGRHGFLQAIMCSASRMPFGQRFYHPIYEAAERNGIPIAIHPGTEGRGISGAPTPSGYPTRYMEWHNILPTNYMTHVNSLVCEGVFEKFPKLKFICIEGGISWIPHLMWRMDKNYKGLRASAPWLKGLPSEYIREHFYFTTQPIEEPDNKRHLEYLIEMGGLEDKIMYASDYPHWDFDNPQAVMRAFSPAIRGKIMGENALRLYKVGT